MLKWSYIQHLIFSELKESSNNYPKNSNNLLAEMKSQICKHDYEHLQPAIDWQDAESDQEVLFSNIDIDKVDIEKYLNKLV
jgi:hypothetical protein